MHGSCVAFILMQALACCLGAMPDTQYNLFFNLPLPSGPHLVTVGQMLVLDCEAGGSPNPTIHWLHNGRRILQGGEERTKNLSWRESSENAANENAETLRLGSTRSRLFIDCVTPADQGKYTCVASANGHSVTSTATLQIADPSYKEPAKAKAKKALVKKAPVKRKTVEPKAKAPTTKKKSIKPKKKSLWRVSKGIPSWISSSENDSEHDESDEKAKRRRQYTNEEITALFVAAYPFKAHLMNSFHSIVDADEKLNMQKDCIYSMTGAVNDVNYTKNLSTRHRWHVWHKLTDLKHVTKKKAIDIARWGRDYRIKYSQTSEVCLDDDSPHTIYPETTWIDFFGSTYILGRPLRDEREMPFACLLQKRGHLEASPARVYMWTSQRLEFEGIDVQLFCRGGGKPTPKITWYDQEGTAITNGKEYRQLENGDLLIPRVSFLDNMGVYTCVAENPYGKDVVETFLYPTSP